MPAYIFYTFRPQISDQGLFEDFLILFLPFIKSHKEYAYSVENDGTLHKHIHAILGSPAKGNDYQDLDKFYQKFNKTNGLKEFKDFARKHSSTTEDGFKPLKVKDSPEDLLHTLGYTLKEHAQRQETNFQDIQVTNAIEYYHAHQRIKSKNPMRKDWTLLTSKNVHAHVERYISENNLTLPDALLGVRLAQDRYSLINLTEKQFRQAVAEIHLAQSKEAGIEPDYNEKEQVACYANALKDYGLWNDFMDKDNELAAAHEEIKKLKLTIETSLKLGGSYLVPPHPKP